MAPLPSLSRATVNPSSTTSSIARLLSSSQAPRWCLSTLKHRRLDRSHVLMTPMRRLLLLRAAAPAVVVMTRYRTLRRRQSRVLPFSPSSRVPQRPPPPLETPHRHPQRQHQRQRLRAHQVMARRSRARTRLRDRSMGVLSLSTDGKRLRPSLYQALPIDHNRRS